MYRIGNDGPWSSFLLGYGSPAQFVRSFISTSLPQSYVVIPGGCSRLNDCEKSRGNFFRTNILSTWQDLGFYDLEFEQNLGVYAGGDFGYDTITLGLPGTKSPSFEHQIVVGIITVDYYLATWGLRPAATNLTTFNNPIPSLLQNMKENKSIPSLSWGYTAGSYQVSKGMAETSFPSNLLIRVVNDNGQGSLTLGGYDAARFESNNATFDFAPDVSRDLVVSVLTIQTGQTSLLGSSIFAYLDSGVSHVWLPEESCQRFQNAFNLTYDETLDLYLVNDSTHDTLTAQNASIIFTLDNHSTASSSLTPITISPPYSAFDLELTPNYPNNIHNATCYFPIRRAANDTQYTLGRAFFQHAYVIADYERHEFSVHQALFPDNGAQQDLQLILSIQNTSNTTAAPSPPGNGAPNSNSLSVGSRAGIIIAAIVVCLIMIICGYCYHLKRKRAASRALVPPYAQETKIELDGEARGSLAPAQLHGQTALLPELPPESKTNLDLVEDARARECPPLEVAAGIGSMSVEEGCIERCELPG